MDKKQIATLTLNPSIDHILCVESIHLHSKNVLKDSKSFYGGKGINNACALGKLGLETTALAWIGKDDIHLFSQRLKKAGASSKILPINQKNRLNFKIMEAHSYKDTEFNEAGFQVQVEDIQALLDLIKQTIKEIDWFILAGSLPPGTPPDLYKRIILLSNEYKVKTCLDTSGDALRCGIRANPTLLRINRQELEELTKSQLINDTEIAIKMSGLHKTGIQMAVVSLGARGAMGMNDSKVWKAEVPPMPVKSTTGAGDAMTAGVIYSLNRQQPFIEALRFGCALASASVMEFEPGEFNPDLLHKILPRVSISAVQIW